MFLQYGRVFNMKTISMNQVKEVTMKAGNMRSPQNFTIYPHDKGAESILIQSDKRIARVYVAGQNAGRMILSRQVQGGAYAPHLSPLLGAVVIDCPAEVLKTLQGTEQFDAVVLVSERVHNCTTWHQDGACVTCGKQYAEAN
jgi:hypothetical protein